MFNKKMFMILLLFIVSICAISTVSAADNVTDTVAIDDVASDDVVTSFNEDLNSEIEDEKVSSYDDAIIANEDDLKSEEVLTSTETDDVLSYGVGVTSSQFSIKFNENGYKISSKNGGTIKYYLEPCTTYSYNGYNFYFSIVQLTDDQGNYEVTKETGVFSSDTDKKAGNRQYTFQADKSLTPGIYLLRAINSRDWVTMDSTILYVTGNAAITTSGDYNSNYNSGATMTITVTDKDTKLPLKYVLVQVAYSNGKTDTYLSDANGRVTFIPTVNAGSYKATISLNSQFNHINVASVTKNVNINKPAVTVKANKVTGYEGCKVKLKATVQSLGKNVNEGKVTFKINGIEYKADVKNGVATKSVTLKKAKTYKYTATFNGVNFQKADAASADAVVKKRTATKLIVNDQKVYRGSTKAFTVTVKTKSGKLVKSGKVKIIDAVKVNKKGKAKFYTAMDLNYIKQVGNTVYFKKSVTKTYKVKYIPSTKAYKPCTIKMKITMKYKCTACGSTKTHSHNGMTFIVK